MWKLFCNVILITRVLLMTCCPPLPKSRTRAFRLPERSPKKLIYDTHLGLVDPKVPYKTGGCPWMSPLTKEIQKKDHFRVWAGRLTLPALGICLFDNAGDHAILMPASIPGETSTVIGKYGVETNGLGLFLQPQMGTPR